MQRIPAKHRALGRTVVDLETLESQLDKRAKKGILGSILDPLLGGGSQTSTAASNPQTSPNPNPSPTPVTGGSQPGNGSGSGVSPSPIAASPSPTNGGGSGVSPSSSPSSNSPSPASGQPSSSSTSSSNGGDGGFLGTGAASSAPVNIESATPTAASVGLATPTPLGVATGEAVPSHGPSGSNTMGIAPSATLMAAGAASTSSHLSSGAIAGIVIVCLLGLFALVIMIVRRRSIARRVQLRQQWWLGHRKQSDSFSFISNPNNNSSSTGLAVGSRNSVRSSFGTHFDQGLMFRVDSPTGTGSLGIVPDLPPMAQVRDRNSTLISTGGAVARRESMNSMLSNGSDHGAQYLSVPAGNKAEPSSPMSVRPFSPSESFSFPKPPVPQAPQTAGSTDTFFLGGGQAILSPNASSSTLVQPPPALIADDLPLVSPSPANPSGFKAGNGPSPILVVANPDASDANPFADPVIPTFSDVETIRRPFTPTLDDELSVFPGDRVRVLQVFDDGWAFVEKLATIQFDRSERGLIPVDCLREAGQALPTFLAQKRVSSYGTSGEMPMGTAH